MIVANRHPFPAPPPGRFGLRALMALSFSLGLTFAARAAAPQRPNEITVSAANYAQTSPDVLAKLFRRPEDLNDVPPPPPPASAAPVRYYQFLPAETLAADLGYADVCKLLAPELAKKNFINTTDQTKVEFILRVTFGERRWRDPFVRKDNLEWSHGLVAQKRGTSLSADQAWDERAGGDESALYQLERDTGLEGMADRLIGGMNTEDYYLIVVDAFELATLKVTGNKTPRAWTTFIAVPRQQDVKFSDVAAKMIEKAAPYFGETLPGKARFTDREGKVKIGELNIVEENVTVPEKK